MGGLRNRSCQNQLLVAKIPKPNVETLKKKEVQEEEEENLNDPKIDQ